MSFLWKRNQTVAQQRVASVVHDGVEAMRYVSGQGDTRTGGNIRGPM